MVTNLNLNSNIIKRRTLNLGLLFGQSLIGRFFGVSDPTHVHALNIFARSHLHRGDVGLGHSCEELPKVGILLLLDQLRHLADERRALLLSRERLREDVGDVVVQLRLLKVGLSVELFDLVFRLSGVEVHVLERVGGRRRDRLLGAGLGRLGPFRRVEYGPLLLDALRLPRYGCPDLICVGFGVSECVVVGVLD